MENRKVNTDRLMDSISQIHKFDPKQINLIREEIESANINFKTSYAEYQSGGWHTATLYNHSGHSEQNEIADGTAIPTEIMDCLPATKKFIEGLGLDMFAVRIAKTTPGAHLWEHCDYIELGGEQKMRLHIPITTAEESRMQFDDCSVHMASGFLWKLNPQYNHGISNDSDTERTHLIIDCYVTPELEAMIDREVLFDKYVRPLPVLDDKAKESLLKRAEQTLYEGGLKEAEALLLKSFNQYDLGEDSSYNLLIELYDRIGFRDRKQYWIGEALKRIYTREKLDVKNTKPFLKGVFLQSAHENNDLPQFEILNEVLETCREIEGLDSAFIRGSMARGEADPFSDIDLLCIVTPENYEHYLNKINKLIAEKYNTVLEPWADTIVKDFGGVGYVHIIDKDGKLFQLDLYVACLGHPSLERLYDLKHKQQVFRAKRKSNLTPSQKQSSDSLSYELNHTEVERVIENHKNVPSSPEETFAELSVLSFMIYKCLKRNDIFVASSEFSMWMKCLIKLARQKYDSDLTDYGFYHVNKLKDAMPKHSTFVDTLYNMHHSVLDVKSFPNMFRFAVSFMAHEYPDIYKKYQYDIDKLLGHIEKDIANDPTPQFQFDTSRKKITGGTTPT